MHEGLPQQPNPAPEPGIQEVPTPEIDRSNPLPPELVNVDPDTFIEEQEKKNDTPPTLQ